VKQDDEQAVNWFRKAGSQGYARAQYNLGWMYEPWSGRRARLPQAVLWIRKAAEQGNVLAQYNLGLMYANAEGVRQDDAEAIDWLGRAAKQGFARAQEVLSRREAIARGSSDGTSGSLSELTRGRTVLETEIESALIYPSTTFWNL